MDPFQHVSSVLCNVTRFEQGRALVLKLGRGAETPVMIKLSSQINSLNPSRRRGAVGCVRNCLFDEGVHWWFVHEIQILSTILMPLVVATPFTEKEKVGMDPLIWAAAENPDKKSDTDVHTVRLLLESIVLLCQKRGVREELRKKRVYPLIRNLDYLQEDERVSEIILDLVNLLERDEDPSTPIDSSDSFAASVGGGGSAVESRPPSSTPLVEKVDIEAID